MKIRNGSGSTTYTYQTKKWPPPVEKKNKEQAIDDQLNSFHSQHTLHRIMRGDLNLNSMTYENRMVWQTIFDEIEEESPQ